MSISLILVLIGATLIITEVIIGVETGLDFLLIGSSLFVGGITGHYINDNTGVIVTIILCVLYVVLGRKYVKNKVKAYTHTSNVDTLLGKTLRVKSFNSAARAGVANVKGEDWRIISDHELKENQEIIVLNIDGVSLIVAPKEKE